MRAHYAAVKARLEANANLTGKVYNTLAKKADGTLITTSYVILYGGTPDSLDDGRVTAPQSKDSDAEYLYTVRSVGVNADAALATASVVAAQLIGFIPAVAGRSCGAMWLDDGGPVQMDSSIATPLFYVDTDYGLRSNRA